MRSVGRVGVVLVALREHGDEAVDGDVLRAHPLALLGDEVVAGRERAGLEARAGPGTERSQREQGGQAERAGGPGQQAHQQPAATELLLAGDQVGIQRGECLLARGHLLPRLLVRPGRQEAVGPRDDTDPDAAEREAQQCALPLRLATAPVHEGQPECGDDADDEGDHRHVRGGRGRSLALSGRGRLRHDVLLRRRHGAVLSRPRTPRRRSPRTRPSTPRSPRAPGRSSPARGRRGCRGAGGCRSHRRRCRWPARR